MDFSKYREYDVLKYDSAYKKIRHPLGGVKVEGCQVSCKECFCKADDFDFMAWILNDFRTRFKDKYIRKSDFFIKGNCLVFKRPEEIGWEKCEVEYYIFIYINGKCVMPEDLQMLFPDVK